MDSARKKMLASMLLPEVEEIHELMKDLRRSTEDWLRAFASTESAPTAPALLQGAMNTDASSTSPSSSACDAELTMAAATPRDVPTGDLAAGAAPTVRIGVISTNGLDAANDLAEADHHTSAKSSSALLQVVASSTIIAKDLTPDYKLAVDASPTIAADPWEFNVGVRTICSTKCLTTSAGVLNIASTTSPTSTLSDGFTLSLALSRSMALGHTNLRVQQVFDEIPQSDVTLSNFSMSATGNVSTAALVSPTNTKAFVGGSIPEHYVLSADCTQVCTTNCTQVCTTNQLPTIISAQGMLDALLDKAKGRNSLNTKAWGLLTYSLEWFGVGIMLHDRVKGTNYADALAWLPPWPPPTQTCIAMIGCRLGGDTAGVAHRSLHS